MLDWEGLGRTTQGPKFHAQRLGGRDRSFPSVSFFFFSASPPRGASSSPYCGWMKSISHHVQTIGNHCLLVFTKETSCQSFLGAGFRPSTVGSLGDPFRIVENSALPVQYGFFEDSDRSRQTLGTLRLGEEYGRPTNNMGVPCFVWYPLLGGFRGKPKGTPKPF